MVIHFIPLPSIYSPPTKHVPPTKPLQVCSCWKVTPVPPPVLPDPTLLAAPRHQPLSSPPNNLDLPIVLKKDKHSIAHPIANFVSYIVFTPCFASLLFH